jgi:hypothetical protein
MKNKMIRISIALAGLILMVALAATLFQKLPEAYAGKPVFFRGETPTYRYSGKVLDDGNILVNVYYLGNSATIQAYREANIQRNQVLLARRKPQRVYVQVTFTHPVPVPEVRALVEETGFQVEDFLMVRRPREQRSWCIEATGDLIKPFCADAGFEGVMVLKGWVETTEQGLGRWIADDRVYMVDSVAVEISEILTQKHADIVAGKQIVVSSEYPIWELDW